MVRLRRSFVPPTVVAVVRRQTQQVRMAVQVVAAAQVLQVSQAKATQAETAAVLTVVAAAAVRQP